MSDALLAEFYPWHPYGVVGPGLVALDPNVAAQGNSQNTATQLVSSHNFITTCPSGAGVILPKIPCAEMVLTNLTAANLLYYPWFGGQIMSIGLNAPATLLPSTAIRLASPDGLAWSVTG